MTEARERSGRPEEDSPTTATYRRRRLVAGGFGVLAVVGAVVVFSALAGGSDPELSESERLAAAKEVSAAVDVGVIEVAIDRCDESGAAGTVTNTGPDDAVVRLEISFETADGRSIHQAGNRLFAVPTSAPAPFEFAYLAALAPADHTGPPVCSAAVAPPDPEGS